jgi:hypothetical protein
MIHHACFEIHNFGDYLGPFIYQQVTGRDYQFTTDLTKPHLMIAGSILQHANSKTTVLGCGFGNATQKVTGKPKLKIIRGPLSGKMLVEQGFKPTWQLGDPGLVLPYIYNPTVEKQYKLLTVPHYVDFPHITVDHKVDLTGNIKGIIRKILAAEKVITSSLHGLIVAHAYGIPALWVEFSDKVVGGGFKFRDYFASVDLKPYKPLDCRQGIPLNVFDIIPTEMINKDFKPVFNTIKTNL